jgi:alanyl-tRNA synthetase
MLGLHIFENEQIRFSQHWKSYWFYNVYGFFKSLQIPSDKIYVHLDSWSDGYNIGPSTQFFINGKQIGNVVYTDSTLENQKPCKRKYKYLDVGIGLERLHDTVSVKKAIKKDLLLWDHLRSLIIAINDGILPSTRGTGYNLRKLCQSLMQKFLKDNSLEAEQELTELASQELSNINSELQLLTGQQYSDKVKTLLEILTYEKRRLLINKQ